MIVSLAPEHIEDVSLVHETILPQSFLARLGPKFLREFYYPGLLASPLGCGFVCIVEGQLAGFTVGTVADRTFFKSLVASDWVTLARVTTLSLLGDHRRLAAILRGVRFILAPPSHYDDGTEAVIVTTAIRPEFRSLEFVRATGMRVAHDLTAAITRFFHQQGASRVKTHIETYNLLAHAFYTSFGFSPDRELLLYGMPHHRYLLELSSQNRVVGTGVR